jgi:hypothetical protein
MQRVRLAARIDNGGNNFPIPRFKHFIPGRCCYRRRKPFTKIAVMPIKREKISFKKILLIHAKFWKRRRAGLDGKAV